MNEVWWKQILTNFWLINCKIYVFAFFQIKKKISLCLLSFTIYFPKHMMCSGVTYCNCHQEALTGGIEVVPLMARRRSFKKSSHLPSCDVTNAAITHR